jgi:hypothetical protein
VPKVGELEAFHFTRTGWEMRVVVTIFMRPVEVVSALVDPAELEPPLLPELVWRELPLLLEVWPEPEEVWPLPEPPLCVDPEPEPELTGGGREPGTPEPLEKSIPPSEEVGSVGPPPPARTPPEPVDGTGGGATSPPPMSEVKLI